jgi:hypothetical protein
VGAGERYRESHASEPHRSTTHEELHAIEQSLLPKFRSRIGTARRADDRRVEEVERYLVCVAERGHSIEASALEVVHEDKGFDEWNHRARQREGAKWILEASQCTEWLTELLHGSGRRQEGPG